MGAGFEYLDSTPYLIVYAKESFRQLIDYFEDRTECGDIEHHILYQVCKDWMKEPGTGKLVTIPGGYFFGSSTLDHVAEDIVSEEENNDLNRLDVYSLSDAANDGKLFFNDERKMSLTCTEGPIQVYGAFGEGMVDLTRYNSQGGYARDLDSQEKSTLLQKIFQVRQSRRMEGDE